MAITGNLKTFYLSSVLQLLSNDKKTGILELTDGSDIVQVYLRDGTIINAFGSSRVERLTNYLRSEGIISEEELEKCQKISAHTEKKIGMVLVEQGIISPEKLESLLHRQIEQTLYSLFLWEQGEFQYRDQNFDLSGQIITSFDTMQVVLEASRRVDEISEIKKRVPMDDEVLKVNPSDDILQKTKLNTVERAVLSLINGKRSIKRVINDSGYDELKVYKTLFSLIASGLLLEKKKILERPEDIHEEIVEPADVEIIDDAIMGNRHVAADEDAGPEVKIFDSSNELQSDDVHKETVKPNQTNDEIFDTVATSDKPAIFDEHKEPAGKIFDSPDDIHPDQEQELDELILELESETKEQPAAKAESVPGLFDSMDANPNQPDKTIVKIDGKLISDNDSREKEPVTLSKPKHAGGNRTAAPAFSSGKNQDFAEEEYAREKKRLLKKAVIITAAVLALLVAIVLLKMLLFSETPEQEAIQTPVTEQASAEKKKAKKPVKQMVEKPAPQDETKTVSDALPIQPESDFNFFQDTKGWISINLPSGFTVSEQPHQDQTSVILQYKNNIRITLFIMPQLDSWNAENDMYASVMKLQESGSRKIQKYNTLKKAGCPGYVLHFLHEKDRQSVQTALYRFVCFNKNVRIEITSLNWRTSDSRELCQKICTAIEKSLFIYQ